MDLQRALLSGVLIVLTVAVLTLPLIHYVRVGWAAKRKDIMDGFNLDARLAYFEMFSRGSSLPTHDTVSRAFERLHSEWYGRKHFLAPGLLLGLTGLIAGSLVIYTVSHWRGYMDNPLFDLPDPAIAALSGAYMWVVNDFTSRTRRLDFSPSDVHWGTLRLMIAVPMGYAFQAVAAPSIAPFIAFALGAFPLATLTSILQRLTDKNLGIEPTEAEASDDVIRLQGINKAIVARLAGEDITTVTQMAYCNPVQLVMRSNLTFDFVTDCMNQALAWMYLEDDLATLRPLGIRGAVEIKRLVSAYDLPEGPSHDLAVAVFPQIAAAIKQTPETLELTFREIAADGFTVFLARVWP